MINVREKIAELEEFLGMQVPGKTRDQEKAVNENSDEKCARIAAKIESKFAAEETEDKVIGKTDSGKSIYDTHNHDEHKDFTEDDHADAVQLHHDLAGKAHKSGDHGAAKNHWQQGGKHSDCIESDEEV